ncbi:UPF0149 family protein [Pseudoalteromonas sp. SMS1]|uniref:YecA family protein n=1 Tax=Pseudoalteromonas luteoviolacea DSM 6061 TaxID=1365250 RepID=A0A166X3E3_9GAMM|nr:MULTISPECIES: UPF0149 family protein [Pseudoalteromonas]KZN39554.1 hypothetical protein N475_14145 [Pseudoalteromonas luteoviolacea DSM 6061]KZN57823.1 hypothetical protein N474_07535 [Pseudoalteromonas luteoviolacea CPMOR-2]MBE0388395.1 hypothetical protein [Pseudoalteromonas luteoviolacea DSM 6061]MCF2856637.1 UPF0149 family protein [Pseudoalteromonas sp. SMS1]TQF66862.1 UPF0149 family protein [Pseudoalteromonas luteoviolacea]
MIELKDYQQAQLLLEKHGIFVAPSEVHGTISGILACGLNIDEKEYLGLLSDVFNDGQGFGVELKVFLAELYKLVVEHFNDPEYAFEVYLPQEDEALIDQANALVAWVSGFLLGFGLKQKDYGKLSADVKEVISDFSEITKLDTHFDDTEEDKQAFHEVVEYIRVSALLCFAEMGREQGDASTSKTVH